MNEAECWGVVCAGNWFTQLTMHPTAPALGAQQHRTNMTAIAGMLCCAVLTHACRMPQVTGPAWVLMARQQQAVQAWLAGRWLAVVTAAATWRLVGQQRQRALTTGEQWQQQPTRRSATSSGKWDLGGGIVVTAGWQLVRICQRPPAAARPLVTVGLYSSTPQESTVNRPCLTAAYVTMSVCCLSAFPPHPPAPVPPPTGSILRRSVTCGSSTCKPTCMLSTQLCTSSTSSGCGASGRTCRSRSSWQQDSYALSRTLGWQHCAWSCRCVCGAQHGVVECVCWVLCIQGCGVWLLKMLQIKDQAAVSVCMR